MRIMVLITLVMMLAMASCRGQPTSATSNNVCKPEVQNLLIDSSSFPSSWSASQPTRPADHHGAIRRCGLVFSVPNGVAVEEIYEYETIGKASHEFERQLDVWFTQRSIDTPWKTPPLPEPVRSIADDFRLACSIQGGVSMCRVLARYGVVVMRFNTHMSPEFMSYTDLEKVLQAIDDKMTPPATG
jgi:hypothetical protein